MNMNGLAKDYIDTCWQRYKMALDAIDSFLDNVISMQANINFGDFPFVLEDSYGFLLYIRNKNDIQKLYPFYVPDDDDINHNFDSLATLPAKSNMLRLLPLEDTADVNLLDEGDSLEPMQVTLDLFSKVHDENFVDIHSKIKQLNDEIFNDQLLHAMGKELLKFDYHIKTEIVPYINNLDEPIVDDDGNNVLPDDARYEVVIESGSEHVNDMIEKAYQEALDTLEEQDD